MRKSLCVGLFCLMIFIQWTIFMTYTSFKMDNITNYFITLTKRNYHTGNVHVLPYLEPNTVGIKDEFESSKAFLLNNFSDENIQSTVSPVLDSKDKNGDGIKENSAGKVLYDMGHNAYIHGTNVDRSPNSKQRTSKNRDIKLNIKSLFSSSEKLQGIGAKTSKQPCKIVIPNLVHFVWFSPYTSQWISTFRFVHLMSVLSAIKIQKPTNIFFWHNCNITGPWWKYLNEYIAENDVSFELKYAKAPTHVFDKAIIRVEHKSDVFRLQCLQKYGGIYLDLDVIVVNPLTPLMCYNFTLGHQGRKDKLNNGIILSTPRNEFIDYWWIVYKEQFKPTSWAGASVDGATMVAREHPDLIHIEMTTMNRPHFLETHKIYKGHFNWTSNYCVHLWTHMVSSSKYNLNPEIIKYIDTAIGEIYRYIWYGDPALFPVDTHEMNNLEK